MDDIALYATDFVIIKGDGEPLEGLDVIYHYSSIIDDINANEGFKLEEGEALVSMADLPMALKDRYLSALRELKHG